MPSFRLHFSFFFVTFLSCLFSFFCCTGSNFSRYRGPHLRVDPDSVYFLSRPLSLPLSRRTGIDDGGHGYPNLQKSWCRYSQEQAFRSLFWVANKRLEISKFKFKIPRARTSELQGSFSAVSKPNFASKYSLESSRRDLHNALLCTVL